MARSQNPMEAFRREQKKKELKKNQSQRQKEKQAKLHELDVEEIRDRLKKLERQVQQNPADGPTRKRKQELEDTLQAVLKKQKAMEDEQKAKEEAAKPSTTLDDINAANRERYQNPENSIYYHPVLNPFGAPPPGRPQMYRVPPPKPVAAPKPAASQSGQQGQQHHKSHRPGGGGPRPAAPPHATVVRQSGLAKPQRPGKRPPLPPGPPPPGTIQVPSRPPLPSDRGAVSHRPPPPPPAPNAVVPPPPPPPAPLHPGAPSPVIPASTADTCMEDSGVVGVYPPPDTEDAEPEGANDSDFYQHHTDSRQDRVEGTEEDTLERAEQQQRLRSLVPTTLRVQRTAKTKTVATAVPRPLAPPPGPSLPPAPLPVAAAESEVYKPADAASSVSSEFDAFMEEMKSLGAV